MRRASLLMVTILLVGCGGDPLAFDLSHPMELPQQPFSVTGAAVTEGVVCPDGLFVEERAANSDGDEISFDEWAQMFDAAVASGGVAEMVSTKDFKCKDDTGWITIVDHIELDFSVLDPAAFGSGETVFGSWTIEGTGDYASLKGSGETVIDWDEMQYHYVGTVEG